MAPNPDETPRSAHPLSRAVQILGSILSVALVIGLGVWGYKLLMRDVSGVPVIRAAEGPMRVQPEDPGGRQALNQGLSVNDVAAVGTAGAAPDQLILAPAPLELSEEDAPVQASDEDAPAEVAETSVARPAPEPAPAEPAPAEPSPADPAPQEPRHIEATSAEPVTGADPELERDRDRDSAGEAAPEMAPATGETEMAVDEPVDENDMQALAEAISRTIKPLEALPDTSETQMVADTETAIASSPRPRPRPADLRDTGDVADAPATTGARDVDPETIPVGTRLAQLGAYPSEDIAREEWDRLGKRFEEYLAGKDRVIQRATSGGRTFYRLRAMGFDDLADARRFCSALVAEKAECIPVVTR